MTNEMEEYKYLISYHFTKKEFSPELNREVNTNGFGDVPATITGELTYSKIEDIRKQIKSLNDFSGVVILNIIRLEKVQ